MQKYVSDTGLIVDLAKADTTQSSRTWLSWYFEPWEEGGGN